MARTRVRRRDLSGTTSRTGGPPSGIPALETGVPALILRFDRNLFHHGTLGVVRSLGRAGVEVHAILEGPEAPSASSRYLHRRHPWLDPASTAARRMPPRLAALPPVRAAVPYGGHPGDRQAAGGDGDEPAVRSAHAARAAAPSGGPGLNGSPASAWTASGTRPAVPPADARGAAAASYDQAALAGLRAAAERIGRPAVLMTVDDRGAIFVAEHAAELAGWFLFPRTDPGLPRRLSDKAELARLCAQAGIAHPATRQPGDRAELDRAVAELGLPLVAKWRRPWLVPSGSGLRSTTVVRTAEEAAALFARRDVAGGPLLLQRSLPEADGVDWFFHGYFDAASRCLLSGTGRKEHAYPARAGLTSLGRCRRNAELAAVAERFITGLGYHGVVDMDFRYDPVSGRYHLLDCNARLGAQFRLFATDGGLDLARAVHLDLTGRPVPRQHTRPGRAFLVENYGLLSAVQGGPRGLATWPRSLRGVEELAWFAADDTRPFLHMAGVWGRRGVERAAAAAGARLGRG